MMHLDMERNVSYRSEFGGGWTLTTSTEVKASLRAKLHACDKQSTTNSSATINASLYHFYSTYYSASIIRSILLISESKPTADCVWSAERLLS